MWAELHRKKSLLVVGVGNLIQRDDGFGVHLIRALAEEALPDCVDLFDGGTLGPEMLPWLEGRSKIVFIDAVNAGMQPGTLFRFGPKDLTYRTEEKTSIHQLGLIDTLSMAELMGTAPDEVVIIGVQPKVVDWGEELSSELASVIPKVINLVKKEISDFSMNTIHTISEEHNE
jgi:hydrogenase maturation protease